jgi:hypothetical protein
MGSVYKLPERRVDDSYHNWRVPSKWRGEYKGVQGGSSKGQKKANGSAPCICHIYM